MNAFHPLIASLLRVGHAYGRRMSTSHGSRPRWMASGVVAARHGVACAGLLVMVSLACATTSTYGTVLQDVVRVSPNGALPFAVAGISYAQPGGGGAGLWATITREEPDSPFVIITPVDYVVANPFSWYVASEGDIFDATSVMQRTPFAANWGVLTPIRVRTGVPCFLASWAGDQFDMQATRLVIESDDTYTWGRFVVSDDGDTTPLSIISSAMAYDGVIVGKPVSVLEPASCTMALAGLACGGGSIWRRRRRASRPRARS